MTVAGDQVSHEPYNQILTYREHVVFPLIAFGTFAWGNLSLHPFLHCSLPPPKKTNFISEPLFHLPRIKAISDSSSLFCPTPLCFFYLYFFCLLLRVPVDYFNFPGTQRQQTVSICVCPHVRSHIAPLIPVTVGSTRQHEASLCQNWGQKAQTPTAERHPTVWNLSQAGTRQGRLPNCPQFL